MNTPEAKKKQLIALKKARTLLDKIITMEEDGIYCINIIQQNLAVIGLLKNVNLQLLDWHLHHCFINAVKSWNEKRLEEMTQELLKIVKVAQDK